MYLEGGYEQYAKALEMFDHMIEFSAKKEGDASQSILHSEAEAFEKECLWILSMLNYTNTSEALSLAYAKIRSDLKDRNMGEILNKILAKMLNKQATGCRKRHTLLAVLCKH